MGILDDAIREHLELKRQHGADESALKQLEGEAFGPPERPGAEVDSGSLADAPTEFMQEPELSEAGAPENAIEAPGADVKPPEVAEDARIRRVPGPEIADLQEGPETDQAESVKAEPEMPEGETGEPAQEEAPAMEHEAISDAPDPVPESSVAPEEPSDGPATEERQAIADHPTEHYDVEDEEFGARVDVPGKEDLAPDVIDEVEDDFFDEKRLSDELDEALDAPLDSYEDEPEPVVEQVAELEAVEESGPDEASSEPEAPSQPGSHDDVLDETPDFLEEAPEDDQLWFEQKPPKDFDFDD